MNAPRIVVTRGTFQRRRQLRLLLAGIACVIAGEALCFLGLLTYPHFVHVACHLVFYAGILLCVAAAVLRWSAS
jgi:hypothetical protein